MASTDDIVDLEEALSPDHYLVNYLRRNHSRISEAVGWDCPWMLEAADEIERLRNTLTVIADAVTSEDGELPGGSAYAIGRIRIALEEARHG